MAEFEAALRWLIPMDGSPPTVLGVADADRLPTLLGGVANAQRIQQFQRARVPPPNPYSLPKPVKPHITP